MRRLEIIALVALCGGACSRPDSPTQPQAPASPTASADVIGQVEDYQVIDLGNLGQGTDVRASAPLDINEAGQIVGSSNDPTNIAHAFIWEDGVMTDLNQLGASTSTAFEISEDGRTIYGFAQLADGTHLVVWEDRVMRSLVGPIPGGGAPQDVAGWEHGRGEGALLAIVGSCCSDPVTEHAILVRKNRVIDLGVLTQAPVLGRDVNSSLMVVGQAWADQASSNDRPERYHPFVWERGRMRDLGVLGERPCEEAPQYTCGSGYAFAINDNGTIAGGSQDASGATHAVQWENAQVRDLNVAFARHNLAVGINATGVIIGQSSDAHPFVSDLAWSWSAGVATPLPGLGGLQTHVSWDNGINDRGEIVGGSELPSRAVHAVVWRDGRVIDLGAFSSVDISDSRTLNQRGDVIGVSLSAENGERAILWRRVTP